jgi:hypothetical protein
VRWLVLYLRSRQVAAGAGVALACVAGLRLLAGDSPIFQEMLAVLAVALVATVAAAGLAGVDPALERTAALDWRVRRSTHVVAVGVLTAVLGVVVGPPMSAEVVVRDAVGLTGLAALGVTLLGGGLAWCVPVTWTVVAVSAWLAARPPVAPLVTWPFQPPATTAATVAAWTLGLGGLLVYAARGPRAQ